MQLSLLTVIVQLQNDKNLSEFSDQNTFRSFDILQMHRAEHFWGKNRYHLNLPPSDRENYLI